MLRRFHLLGMLLGLLLTSMGCGGGSDVFQNLTFDYEPEFASYTGGTGLAGNTLGGAWKLSFSRAVSGGGEILQETDYSFIAQAVSAGKAIGFMTNPEDRASAYVEIFLTGSAIDVRLFEYSPQDDRVVRIIAQGTFDLGLRSVSTTTYSVEVFDGGSKRDGTGTWDGFVTDVVSPDFEPASNGAINGLRFVCADDRGQGDMEAAGLMDVTISGTTLTGSADIFIINDEGVEITDGTLNVSGNRVGGANGNHFTLAFSGVVGGVAFTGTGVLTVTDTGTDTRFAGDNLYCGEILLESDNTGGSIIRARDFGGTIGFSEFDF